MGEGNGNWKAPVIGLRNKCAPEKLLMAQRQFAPLCMIQPFIISVYFQNLGSGCSSRFSACFFFRNPGKHFAGLRSGTFFSLKTRIQVYSYLPLHVIVSCFKLVEHYVEHRRTTASSD